MKYIGSKVLESENLILRPTKEEDLKVIWGILCDKKVAKNYLVGKFNYDWEKEKVWQYKKLEKANNEDVFQWSIILKSENKCIGQASCQKSYDEFGNDINECLEDPCPEGYTCMNLPGSFLWEAPDGEIIEGDGDSSSKGYKVHDGDCSFSASIDADGYVTIFGIRKFVGLNAKGVYKKTFYGVRRDCELNGTFLCKPHTCAKFWLDMK